MITCPVCEHTQAQGEECENCGKRLSAPRAAGGGDVPRMPELEGTHHAGGGAPVNAALMPELEQTRQRGGPDLPPLAFPEMERTRMGAPGDVDAPMLADLDTGRSADDGVRTQAPAGPVTCRYCHHVQTEGAICDKCGMRLPRVATPDLPAEWGGDEVKVQARARKKEPEDLWVRCRCGAPAKAGKRCGDCGEMVAIPSEV
jgi:hypothetical protein